MMEWERSMVKNQLAANAHGSIVISVGGDGGDTYFNGTSLAATFDSTPPRVSQGWLNVMLDIELGVYRP